MRPLARGLVLFVGLLAPALAPAPAAAAQPRGKLYLVIVLDTDCARADKEVPGLGRVTLGDLTPALVHDANILRKVLDSGIGPSRLSVTQLTGPAATPASLRDHLARLPVTRDDTLVVFFGGHGLMLGGQHTLMFSGSGRVEATPRARVRDMLTARNPRLAVLLSDSCSNEFGARLPGSPVKPVTGPGGGSVAPGFERLFFDAHGVVDINGSYEGTYAWNHPERGGVFTIGLGAALFDAKDRSDVTWPGFYWAAKTNTEATFKDWQKEARGLPGSDPRLQEQKAQTTQAFYLPGTRMKVFTFGESGEGQRVVEMPLDSPGRAAGLQDGDLIVGVNGRPVRTQAAWVEQVSRPLQRGETEFNLLVRRGGREFEVNLTVPSE